MRKKETEKMTMKKMKKVGWGDHPGRWECVVRGRRGWIQRLPCGSIPALERELVELAFLVSTACELAFLIVKI